MNGPGDVVFLGVDLGWYGKPSGLASIGISQGQLFLQNLTRLEKSARFWPGSRTRLEAATPW